MMYKALLTLLTAATLIIPEIHATPTGPLPPPPPPHDKQRHQSRSDSDLSTGEADCESDFVQVYEIEMLGKSEIKDSFQEAAIFRGHSQDVCDRLIPPLYKSKEYTLYYPVDDSDIYVYSANVLWNKPLEVVYKVTLTKEGHSRLHGKNAISQADFKDFCIGALETYGTKDEGCTKDPPDFHNSVVKRTTTTGVLPGSMEWMDGDDHFATFHVNFKKRENHKHKDKDPKGKKPKDKKPTDKKPTDKKPKDKKSGKRDTGPFGVFDSE